MVKWPSSLLRTSYTALRLAWRKLGIPLIPNFFDIDIRKWKWHHRVCLVEMVRKCTFWPSKDNFKIWPQVRSDQGQVMAQVGKYAYLPKRLDELSRLAPFARLIFMSRVIGKKWIETSCDLLLTQDHQLHPYNHGWDEWLWSWKNWVVSVDYAKQEAFYFPVGL